MANENKTKINFLQGEHSKITGTNAPTKVEGQVYFAINEQDDNSTQKYGSIYFDTKSGNNVERYLMTGTHAITANKVIDSNDSREISITYSKSGQNFTYWLASWNGRELGSISPSKITAGKATKLETGRTISLTGAVTGTSSAFDGSSNLSFETTLSNFDASKITSGTISIDRLPAAALERVVVVANATARKALTIDSVQLGDVVQETDTGLMYFVVDTSKLNADTGYKEFTAGTAAKAGQLNNSLLINGKTFNGSSQINVGTIGTAYGGTGITSNPSMLVNLGSTTAANVFAAIPRPGITGTLAVSHGGTGATTAANARTNLEVPSKTGSGASGTWDISITGSANSASTLATARTLWGQSFNGSSNVTGNMTSVGTITSTTDSTYDIGSEANHWRKGYFDELYVSTDNDYKNTSSGKAGTYLSSGILELFDSTPHIDFHYQNTTSDYSARLIADATNRLCVQNFSTPANFIYNNRTINPLLYVTGCIYSDSSMEATGAFVSNGNSNQGGFLLRANNREYGKFFIDTLGTVATNTSASTSGIAYMVLGNNTAPGASGTTVGTNNAYGVLRLYANNIYYTDIRSQGNGNRKVYLPNYNSDMYLIHASGNSAVGSATKPVYIAANGRATVGTYELKSTVNAGTANNLAYYSDANAISSYTSTIGSSTKPVYLNAGVPTAISSYEGNSTTATRLKYFTSSNTTFTWGTLGNNTDYPNRITYSKEGGDIAFGLNSSNSAISMQIDGYFYQNNGSNKVFDVSGGELNGSVFIRHDKNARIGLYAQSAASSMGLFFGIWKGDTTDPRAMGIRNDRNGKNAMYIPADDSYVQFGAATMPAAISSANYGSSLPSTGAIAGQIFFKLT